MGSKLPGHLIFFFTLAGIFFLQVLPVYAQQKYNIQHYTNEKGLPTNSIKGIELDKKAGFLWVGTQAGLVRFDGKHFTGFSSPGKEVTDSRIVFIAKNREGDIYCEDDNFSVYRIIGNKPVFEMTDTFLIAPFTLRGGIYPVPPAKQFAENVRKHQRSSFLSGRIVFHDEMSANSSFSFIYYDHAFHYSAVRDTLLRFPDFDKVLKLDGRVYFVRNDLELWAYNDSTLQLLRVPVKGMPRWNGKTDEKPGLIWEPGMKEAFLIHGRDIWKLQREGNILYLQPVCRECSPAGAHITAVQTWEEQGIIFLSSDVNGLFVVRSHFLHTVQKYSNTKAGRSEYAQAEIEPGVITTGSGLTFSAQGKLLPDKSSLPFHQYTIYQDLYGDHWSYAEDTVIHFHRKNGRYTKILTHSGAFKMVFVQTQNRIYVISDIAIAAIINDQYRLLYKLPYSANILKRSLNPDMAIEWKPGVLAIASEKLLLFDTKKGKAPDTIPIPGLTAKVRGLLKYGDYLFIGTYGQGFYIYKNGVVKKMPLDKSGYLSYTHCFLPDDNGFCWISTNRGLFKASLQALITAYESNLNEIYYHYLGKNDGMFDTELNGGCQPCALKLSSGLYSFPYMKGVVVFDPLRTHVLPPAGQLFIEEIVADSRSYQPGDSSLRALPYHLRNLRFKITMPQFGNPENIYCSYKLEPYNDTWEAQDIGQNDILQFGGLPPGSYQLKVRVRNGFEPNQFGSTVLEFCILEPWYQAWWFYAGCVVGLLVIIGGLVKWRTARINKRKEELQQLVAMQTASLAAQSRQLEDQLRQLQSQQLKLEEDNKIKASLIGIISHDMIGPLKSMSYMSKNLRDAFSPGDPEYHRANAFVTVTQELESLGVNMLNWIRFHHDAYQLKPERFNLHRLIHESTEIVAVLAGEKGVRLYNDIPLDTFIWQYRPAMGVIIYNLAMNAMKYTERGAIYITGRLADNGFTLQVTDTGAGMTPELVDTLNNQEYIGPDYLIGGAKKFQFGYPVIRDLLRLTQGIMKVESTLNKGTTVIINFQDLKMPDLQQDALIS